jgi:hypothetical protein
MNILDNNSDFNSDEEINAEYVMNQSMTALWDLVIEPMQEKLSQEDMGIISLIGVSLKLIAQKASLHEATMSFLQEGELNDPKENDFSRN